MKKALMVLGFAMCATIAFAQTSVDHRDIVKNRAVKPNPNEMKAQQVDYKASIFSKDAMYDTVRCFRFDSVMMDSVTFGDITANDHIKKANGQDSSFATTYHSVSYREQKWSRWRHYADSNEMKDSIFTHYPTWVARFFCGDGNGGTDFSWVLNRIGAKNNDKDPGYEDDGFMFFGYDFNTNLSSNKLVNTYFTLPTVHRTLPNGQRMVIIGVNQAYYKFADQCHIDYKIGNDWYTREINVYGIDLDINTAGASKQYYIMPVNLANQTDITLRVRVYAVKYATYGYGWFLDNLAVITDKRGQSWAFNHSTPLDGFYGTIPQGMTIPVTYGVHVRNTGFNDIPNARLTVSNQRENGPWTEVATSDPSFDIPAGDVEKDYKLWISERGFLHDSSRTEYGFNYGIHSFLGRFENYGNQGELTGGYLGRSLNTDSTGINYYTIKAECDSASQTMVREFDTVLYTVSAQKVFFNAGDSNRVSGYRWGRDNGLVPAGSAFRYSYNDRHYIDPEDSAQHTYEPGYEIVVRYVTGSEVPEDGEGNPWVFRGIEYVPATNMTNPLDMTTESGVLMPIIFEQVKTDDGNLEWVELSGGIDNLLFPITEDAVNNLPSTYALPTDAYSALNIKFVDEIPMKKNTSYLIGYVLYRAAQFRVAEQRWGYTSGDSTVRYNKNEATAPYYLQNTPHMPYDVLVRDAAGTSSDGDHWIMGWNMDQYPMIRPIVGAESPVERVVVTANCGSDTLGFTATRGTDNLCLQDIEVAVGSSVSIPIVPRGRTADGELNHAVISKIYVNGVEATVYDEEEVPENNFWLYEHEYNVHDTFDTSNIILYRNYYTLHFSGIDKIDAENTMPYVITADVRWDAWDLTGIDPVAPETYLSLSPNPATSTVKLNVAGVTGMVNCNIIDMSGRVVYNANFNAETETTINVSNMPAGAYFVRVTNDTFSKIEKLIIK